MKIIDDVNTTIENLLKEEFGDPYPFDLSFAMPDKEFGPAAGGKHVVNFYLYDIQENVELRSNEPIIEKNPDGTTVRKDPPKRIKLSYLITAWSSSLTRDILGEYVRDEHALLSQILHALLKYPHIPDNFLSGDLIGQKPPLPTTVVLPNGLKNPAEFWSTFEGRPVRPAIEYSVTFSLDYHDPVKGKMVLMKMHDYGSITSIFRYTVQPHVRDEDPAFHPPNIPLAKMIVDKISGITLVEKAASGETVVKVDDPSNVDVNDIVMFINGDQTEFHQIKQKQPANQLEFVKSLLFEHEKNSELKRLDPAPVPKQIKLANIASAGNNELRVSGPDVRNLKIGDVLKLNNPSKTEYFQITEISGPERGLSVSIDQSIQIGGIVTNMSGAPIIGAEITLKDATKKMIGQEISNVLGRFSFGNLSQGKYYIQIIAEGYDTLNRSIAEISTVKHNQLIFKLSVS